MKEPEIQYFAEHEGGASALREEAIALHKTRQEEINAFKLAQGADALRFQRTNITGLAWIAARGAEPIVRVGLRFCTRHAADDNNKVFHVYVADKRVKEGKQLAATMASLSRFDFSDHICARLNASRHVLGPASGSRTGMAMYVSTAGLSKGRLVLRVPVDSEEPFAIPSGFVQLKRSEFIALTEE